MPVNAEQSLIPASAPIKIGDSHGNMRKHGILLYHTPLHLEVDLLGPVVTLAPIIHAIS